jgi:hypothetical protein
MFTMLALIILGGQTLLTLFNLASVQEEFSLLSCGIALLLSPATFSTLAPASLFDSHGLNNHATFSFM